MSKVTWVKVKVGVGQCQIRIPKKGRTLDSKQCVSQAASFNSFRSMDEIKEDFAKMKMDVKTDIEIIKELVEAYKKKDILPGQKIDILTDLEFYVHQVRNINLKVQIM